MNIKTERLQLIPISEKDLGIFHETNTNHFVKEFLWDNEEILKSVSTDIICEVEAKFREEKWGLWKIVGVNDDTYLGYIGLWFFFDEKLPQLLYSLLPEHTGNGYATEASQGIINYAFEKLNFMYLIATMDKSNYNSIKVCNRLNMKLVEEKEIEGKPTLFYKLENKNYTQQGL